MKDRELRELSESERPARLERAPDQDFGSALREAREARGISLRSIAVSTKISMATLEALERNEIERLPGGIFSRAFVRSYAREVGLDAESTVDQFIECFGTRETVLGEKPSADAVDADRSESERQMAGTALKLLGFSIPIIVLVLYFTLSGRTTGDPAGTATATAAAGDRLASASPTAAPTRPSASGGSESNDPESNGSEGARSAPTSSVAPAPAIAEPAVSAASSASTGAPERAADDGTLMVTMRTTGPCWVSVTADGERAFARLMGAGDQASQRVRDEIVIQIGNAANFTYAIDGASGRTLGGPGEVVTARITPGNYQTYLRR